MFILKKIALHLITAIDELLGFLAAWLIFCAFSLLFPEKKKKASSENKPAAFNSGKNELQTAKTGSRLNYSVS